MSTDLVGEPGLRENVQKSYSLEFFNDLKSCDGRFPIPRISNGAMHTVAIYFKGDANKFPFPNWQSMHDCLVMF